MKIKTLQNSTLTLFLILFLTVGCKKQPTSEFKLIKYEYSQGEAIEYENYSIDDESSKWEIINLDGNVSQEFEGAHPTMITNILYPDGIYTIRLTTYSKKEKKQSTVEKQILLKSVKKYLTINSNGAGPGTELEYSIYVDNQLIGNSYFNGTFQESIPVGLHLIKLESANKLHEAVYDVQESVSITF
ncbi:MAG: hypothetical protein AB8B56_08880 [Crocinitomicaceae bacterium]